MSLLRAAADHAMRPSGDRYLTPRWVVEFLLQHWTPLPGTLIVDPAAGGWGGWTIGERVARSAPPSSACLVWAKGGPGEPIPNPRRSLLLDIDPAGPDVFRADFLESEFLGPLTLVTNPPYADALDRFLAKALGDATPAGEVVFLIPYIWLTSVGGDRVRGLTHLFQPRRRVQFELIPEDAEARIAWNAEHPEGPKFPAKRSAESATGWTVGSPGGAHCWARWVPGYDGPVSIVMDEAPERGATQPPSGTPRRGE